MAISDILELLEQNGGRLMTSDEICAELDINPQSVWATLRKLHKRKGIFAAKVFSKKTNRMVWKYGYEE